MATLAPGFGMTNRVIIDQHFRQRDRLGRLLTALAYNPFAVGIGLDEDPAAFIAPDNTVHVRGSGGITVVDAADVQFSSMDSIQEGRPARGRALGPRDQRDAGGIRRAAEHPALGEWTEQRGDAARVKALAERVPEEWR